MIDEMKAIVGTRPLVVLAVGNLLLLAALLMTF
jgi:hypothetical protein